VDREPHRGDRGPHGAHEADVRSGKISIASPIARAMIGKETGDVVEVNTPGGVKAYEIVKVEWV
jgi:transcription elongation factor GreA